MPNADIIKEQVELNVSDSTKMWAYTARPNDAARHPGLLVLQEAFGVNRHIRNVSDRFAAAGFSVIAPEFFHRSAPPHFEASYTDFPAVMPHLQAVTPEKAELDLRAAYEWLHTNSSVDIGRIASVGFCLGGRLSFIANSILPLTAAVSFYGGGIAPALLDRAARQHAPILFFWGGLDKHITPEMRRQVTDALTAQKKNFVNVEFSAADHGFFCDERASYEPRAARQAWALTLEFLRP